MQADGITAEMELRRRDERFRALVENSADFITLVDAAGRITYESPNQQERALGYQTGEMVGMNLFECLHPEDRERVRSLFASRLRGLRDSVRIELRVQAKDASYRWLDIVATNLLDDPTVASIVINSRDVSDRHALEQSLRESEKRLALALMGADLGLYDWDLRSGKEVFNARLMEMLGYSLDEVEQHIRFWFDKVHPDDHPRIRAAYAAHFRGETPIYETEHRLRHKNGEWMWMLDRGRVVEWDAEGRPIRFTGTHLDITRQKQAEELLRESEKRFRSLAEAIPQLVWISDARGVPEYANEQLVKYTGMTAAQARVEGCWLNVYHPDDRLPVRQALEQSIKSGSLFQFEYRIRRAADGRYRWFLGRATPLRDERGQVVRWFGTATDIDDQKKMEESLRRAQDELEVRVQQRTAALTSANTALSACEDRYRCLVEQSPDGIGIAVNGKVAFLNRAGCRLLGFLDSTEVTGRSILDFVHPDYRVFVQRRIADLLRTQQALPETEEKFVRADGDVLDVEVVATPVIHMGQTAVQVVFRDITERRRLEEEILAISEREQRHIAQDLHDGLCQHLLGTKHMTKALRLRLKTKQAKEATEAVRIERLIGKAIDESRRIARGLYPVSLEANGLMSALRELATTVRTMFHVRCQFRCPARVLVSDNVVATHLFRITQEAVSNAIQHGKPSQITIRLQNSPEGITLTVQDNGRGLSRKKGSREGMGLRIMKYRADRIGASLDVRCGPKRGMLVACTLPVAPHGSGGAL